MKTIAEQWQAPRDRVLWAPVSLGTGIAAYFALPSEPAFSASAGALAGAAGLLIAARVRFPHLVYVAFTLFLMALGFLLAQGRTMSVGGPMLDRQVNFARVEGRVQDISVADDDSGKGRRKVILDQLLIEKMTPEQTPKEVRLSSYHIPGDVRPGERIAVLARLMPPTGPVAPGGFDYRRQAFFEGIGANGFTMGKFEHLGGVPTGGVWFNTLRQWISERISAQMPHPQSAVATALLAGERSSIPDDVNNDLRDSGLYHLLSISGLHVAIVCGVVFFVVRFGFALIPFIALRLPIKKMAAVAALGAGLFYCLLAGMPVPAQRSILMTGLVLVAVMLDRTALSLRTIALAAFFVLTLRPEALVGASFQLSFAAVLAMVAFYESAGRRLVVQGRDTGWFTRIALYFAGIFITTILVSFATLPPVLHHFGRLQIFGVIANAAAIPLTSFIVMPAGMAALLAMPLGFEGPFLTLVDWGVEATLWVAHEVAAMPHAAMMLPSISLGWYLAGCMGYLWLCLWQGAWRWAGVPVMVAATVLGMFSARPVLMIDAEGKGIAVHGGGQTAYIGKAPTKYTRENWASLWGGTEVAGKPLKTGMWQSGDVAISCDDWACRVTQKGRSLSILRDPAAMRDECMWASTVVALNRAVTRRNCGADLYLFWDVRDGGGLAVYADGDTWRVTGMVPSDAQRPWTLKR